MGLASASKRADSMYVHADTCRLFQLDSFVIQFVFLSMCSAKSASRIFQAHAPPAPGAAFSHGEEHLPAKVPADSNYYMMSSTIRSEKKPVA